MDYTRLGKRIKEERLRLNLTQEKLSEKVGISTAYLGQIERGERCITLDKLIPLANYLGVTVDFLLTDYIVTDEDNSLNILTQLFSIEHARLEEKPKHKERKYMKNSIAKQICKVTPLQNVQNNHINNKNACNHVQAIISFVHS